MKNLLSGILFLFGVAFSFAQNDREVGDFISLKVYDRISVELIESKKNKVEIIGDGSAKIQVINKNGELKIRTKTLKLLQGDDVKVKVYYNDLSDIQASQGSEITSRDVLKTNLLKLTANEGSKIQMRVDVDQLNVRGNSGGEVKLSGNADVQEIVMNSGAKYKGDENEGENVSVTVNAGGKAEVYASKSVNATVRAGGRIEIHGNPKHRDVKKVVGGVIEFK